MVNINKTVSLKKVKLYSCDSCGDSECNDEFSTK